MTTVESFTVRNLNDDSTIYLDTVAPEMLMIHPS